MGEEAWRGGYYFRGERKNDEERTLKSIMETPPHDVNSASRRTGSLIKI